MWIGLNKDLVPHLVAALLSYRDQMADELVRCPSPENLAKFPAAVSGVENLIKDLQQEATACASRERSDLIDQAKAMAQSRWSPGNDMEIDAEAPISEADNGTWVGAWVWVENKEPK